MSVTYFVVQPFVRTEDGLVVAEPKTAQSADAARAIARQAAGKGGAIAFSRSGDPSTGEFSDARVLGVFGEVPEDAAEMASAAA